jgi:hypothetical protein
MMGIRINKRSLIGTGVLLVCLGVVVLVLLDFWRAEPEQTATLPDGSTITLKAVSYGKTHYDPGMSWRRLFVFVPKPLEEKLGLPRTQRRTTEVPSLSICFKTTGKLMPGGINDLRLVNEEGFEYRMIGDVLYWSTGATLEGRLTTVFPRRGKTVKVRVYTTNNLGRSTRAAEFIVRNPAHRHYPVWQPEALPITKQNGEVDFTLTKLVTGVTSSSELKAASNDERAWTKAFFRITQNGQPVQWRPERIEMSDATGNQLASTSRSNETVDGQEDSRYDLLKALGQVPSHNETLDGQEVLRYHQALWPDESAWKLRVEFSRKPDAVFAADELWSIRGIQVPDANSYTESDLKTNLHGATIFLVGMAGEHAAPKGQQSFRGSACLEVNVWSMPDDYRLTLIRVMDESGREMPSTGSAKSVQPDLATYGYGLRLPKDAKTLDITLALHKSRFVEYLVKPATP